MHILLSLSMLGMTCNASEFAFFPGLSVLNLLFFGWVAMRYRYKDVPHAKKRRPTAMRLPPRPVPAWARPQVVDGLPMHRRAVCPSCNVAYQA